MLLKKMSFLLFASLVMVSCSSDDDVDPSGPVITGLDFTITATGSGNIVEVLPSAAGATSFSVDFGSDATDDVLTTVGPKVSYTYAAASASYDITVTASAAGSDNVIKTSTYDVVVEISDVEGRWVLLHDQNALIVAENMDVIAAGGSWWSNNFGHLIERACVFDDVYEFKADMSFNNILGDETWLEGGWAANDETCGAPYAPFDGSATATWSHNTEDNTITLNGMGAFLGIATIQNGSVIDDPANAVESITYSGVTFSEDKNTMTLHIDYGAGFWQFKFAREGSVGAENPTTDTDEDGVIDIEDACPDVAGEGADGCPVVATPTEAAAAPTAAAADVASIYSDSYTDITNANYNPGWGQETQFVEVDINGNMILGYSQLNYQGNTFDGIDLTGKTTLHIDVYSSEIDVLKIVLINTAAAGGTFEIGVSKALSNGAWTSLEIPLSEFEGFVASGGNLDQMKYELGVDGTASGTKSFFLDNIYLH
jgi:hypothetical protein